MVKMMYLISSPQLVDRETSGVGREQYWKLVVAIEKAKDLGLLDVDSPFVEYDYEKYRPRLEHSCQ